MSRDLKLQVVLSAIDKATAPIRGIMQSSSGLGKQLKETRDQLSNLEKQQGAINSFRELKRGSEQSAAALQDQQRRVKELAQQLAATPNPTKAMTREFDAATRAAGKLKAAHGNNTQQLQAVRTRLQQAGVSTRNLGTEEASLRKKITETNSALAAQKSQLEAVAAQQKKLAGAKAQMERTQQLAGNMATTGAAGLATGGGALYGIGRVMQTGIEFDAGMSNVQALTRLDKNSPEMQKLRDQAKILGAETMFTATQAAEGQGFLAMAGFTPEAILDSMPGVLDLAKAGRMELSQTADIVSNVMSAMGMESSEMGRIGDALASTFTSTNTSLGSLGDTMKFAAPVASALGVDIETLLAMTGALGDAGIQGSMAGTGLSTIMTRIAKPTKEVLKGLDKIGISAKDAANQMKTPEKLLEQIYKKTKNMSDSERISVLGAISGQEALKSMVTLVNKAGTQELHESIQARKDALGTSARASKAMSDNLAGDLEGLSSAFDGVKLTVFEGQNSALRSLAASATDVMRAINAWAQANPELVSTIIKVVAVLAALIAAGGAIMLTIGSILGPLAMLRYGMTLFGVKGMALLPIFKSIGAGALMLGKLLMANPIFIAIGLLAAAAYLIYRNWDDMVGGMKQLWTDLGSFFSGLWSEMVGGAKQLWTDLGSFFSNLWSTVTTAFSGGIGAVAALIVNWSPLGLFYQALQPVLDWFGLDLPAKFSEFGANIIGGLVDGIKNMAGAAKDAVMNVGDNVTGWFKDKLGIHSPSRVFAELGGHTIDGLAVGMQAQEDGPLKRIGELGKKLTAAAGLSIPLLAAQPAIAAPEMLQGIDQPLRFDSRPPLQSGQQQGSAVSQPANITINIHAAPGMDTAELARLVRQELEKAQQQQQIRQRSRFGDLE